MEILKTVSDLKSRQAEMLKFKQLGESSLYMKTAQLLNRAGAARVALLVRSVFS